MKILVTEDVTRYMTKNNAQFLIIEMMMNVTNPG